MKFKEVNKALKKEYTTLSKNIKLDHSETLTYRISSERMNKALVESPKDRVIHEFTPEFKDFLDAFRKYTVADVETLQIEADPETPKKKLAAFKETWKRYTSESILRETKNRKRLFKRIALSLIAGIAILIAVVCSAVVAYFDTYDENIHLGIQVTHLIINEFMFTLAWIFIIEGVKYIFYEQIPMKERIINYYKMYIADFVVGKTFKKFKKEKAKENEEKKIDLIKMEPEAKTPEEIKAENAEIAKEKEADAIKEEVKQQQIKKQEKEKGKKKESKKETKKEE